MTESSSKVETTTMPTKQQQQQFKSFYGTNAIITKKQEEDLIELQQEEEQQKQQQQQLRMMCTFVAGVGSGAFSSIICAPLDLIRTRMQVWGDVVVNTTTTTTTTATAKPTKSSSSSSSSSLSSSKSKPKRPVITSAYKVVQDIIRTEGWKGCFRGLGATLVTVPLFWGVYFPLYDETKRYLTKHYSTTITSQPVIHCTSAVFTGIIADIICNPLFVVRTRLQTQSLHIMMKNQQQPLGQQQQQQSTTKKQYTKRSMIQTAKDLYIQDNKSIRIFWRGMTANIMGLSHVAVQFPVYEQLKKYAREQRSNTNTTNTTTTNNNSNTAVELLLASGISKMCASLLTYPHEVLRSRMMDSRSKQRPTLTGTMKSIYIKEGIKGFYTGLPITLLRVVPNCCVTFVSYELLLQASKHYVIEQYYSTTNTDTDTDTTTNTNTNTNSTNTNTNTTSSSTNTNTTRTTTLKNYPTKFKQP